MYHPLDKETDTTVVATLKLNDKNKEIAIKKKHLYLGICVLACLLGAGAGICIKYQQSLTAAAGALSETEQKLTFTTQEKEELSKKAAQLEKEVNAYNDQLQTLTEKTQKIEAKLSELNETKEALYQKLEDADISSTKEDSEKAYMAPADTPTFISYVFTPYNTKNTKTALLEAKLDNLLAEAETEEIAYIDVAENITETIARKTAVPNKWPVNGSISSGFSFRADPIHGEEAFHTGLDIACPIGTPVKATASGVVIRSEFNNGGYGYMVELRHDSGFTTLYAHNSSLLVKAGDKVQQGDVIAYSGATGRVTGPHSHYEVKLYGELQNPIEYLPN